jgi:hypothetical protein
MDHCRATVRRVQPLSVDRPFSLGPLTAHLRPTLTGTEREKPRRELPSQHVGPGPTASGSDQHAGRSHRISGERLVRRRFLGGQVSAIGLIWDADDPAYQLIFGPYVIEISRIRVRAGVRVFLWAFRPQQLSRRVLGLSAMERPAEVPALVGLLLVGAHCRRAHASLQPFGRGRVDPFHWTIRLT